MDYSSKDYMSSSSSDSESEDEAEIQSGPGPPIEAPTDSPSLSFEDVDEPLLVLPPEDLLPEGDIEEDGEGAGEEPAKLVETDEDKPKKKKKKRKKWYYICTSNCKYESVRRVAKRFGFKEVAEDEDWNLYWTDYSVALERVMDMKKYQKINHFPGMSEICRKDLLARNMNRMLKLFPKDFNVFPKSWCLPADYGDFQSYTRTKKHKTYILKPESGCQGKGIWVTKNTRDIKPQEHMLCQQYISKFDFRVYTLVTSCDPLRAFAFKDGLVRFATTKYLEPTQANVENVYMHLTNYAINKHSTDYIRDDEAAGSKRRIVTINRWFENNGFDINKIWRDIDDAIIKVLISAHSVLKHNYRTCFPNHVKGSACFEILGFDVMLDKKLKPYVLEVNHSPSFHTDAKLDKEIKEALLSDTLNIVNFPAVDKKKCIEEEKRKIKERLFQRHNKKEQKEEMDKAFAKWLKESALYEDMNLGNFRRIYPPPEGTEKYEKFFHSSGSLYQETAAFKARSEAAKQQRDEISRKKEKMDIILKKKKDPGMRPESPNARKKRRIPSRRLTPSMKSSYELSGFERPMGDDAEPIDTHKPVAIIEEDELERISGLMQRDNLVRGLGIVEHVYRLLHCTPGTVGLALRSDHKQRAHLPQVDALTVIGAEKTSHAKYQLWQAGLTELPPKNAANSASSHRHVTRVQLVGGSAPGTTAPSASAQARAADAPQPQEDLSGDKNINPEDKLNRAEAYVPVQRTIYTQYHQGLNPGQRSSQRHPLVQLMDKPSPARTRYTNRRTAGTLRNDYLPGDTYTTLLSNLDRVGNKHTLHEAQVTRIGRSDSAGSGRFAHRLPSATNSSRGIPTRAVSEAARVTPRPSNHPPGTYTFPNLVKVSPRPVTYDVTSFQVGPTAQSVGLSVVSAPAPVVSRADASNGTGVVSILQNARSNVDLTQPPPGARIRAGRAPRDQSQALRLKSVDVRENQVYS